MPAIQPTVLKHQTAELAAQYSDLPVFRQSLFALFEFYADRTYRPGATSKSFTLLPNFRLPAPVMRQIMVDLSPIVAEHPVEMIALIDNLWAQGYLETYILAVSLLSLIPLDPPDPVIERLLKWTQPDLDQQILNSLLSTGMKRVQNEQPTRWLEIAGRWLSDPNQATQAMGLRALNQGVSNDSFENIPMIFTLITPLIQNPQSGLYPELQALLGSMGKRSPAETTYFLRQSLQTTQNPGTARLVRHYLTVCPAEYQTSLREALANQPKGI